MGTNGLLNNGLLLHKTFQLQILYLDLQGCNKKFLIEAAGENSLAYLRNIRFTARCQDIHVFGPAGKLLSYPYGRVALEQVLLV